MRILVIGAGVLGCNLAHNFYKAGKDVTLLARGRWGKIIQEKGLVIKNKFSVKSSCDKISVISELDSNSNYDVIFVCLRYTQLQSIIDTLHNNPTANIVFIGNNVEAEYYADALSEKNVMFGFVSTAGHRESDHVESIDLKKITIGDLKTHASNKSLIDEIFAGTKYKIVYEDNIGDYLISHAAFVIPAAFACYYTDGNLKKIKNNKEFIYKIIDANAECYAAVEALGHELLPKGEEAYRSDKYRKMCYRFYKLMCATTLGKLCASDHAMSAVDEMSILATRLEEMIQESGIEAENFKELKQYMTKYVGK